MDRKAKLLRWAEALDLSAPCMLKTLTSVEYSPLQMRGPMREDHSPLGVAARDPVLRAEGLRNDTYGEAMRFFERSHADMHKLVCRCHLGFYVPASRMADQVWRVATSPLDRVASAIGYCFRSIRARFA
jgi:hypothetical protein